MRKPVFNDSRGRPLPAETIQQARRLMIQHLSTCGELPEDEHLQLAMADQILRTMMLLGVPLERLAGQDDPRAVAELIRTYGITPQHQREIEYAVHRAAEFVKAWPTHLRHDLRKVTTDAVRARVGGRELAEILRDRYADRNLDVETIANTEIASAHNNATIAGQQPGGYVLGQTFPDSCLWCRMNIHGNVLQVVEPPRPNEDPITSRDWDHQIWVGKSNRGRRKYLYEGKTRRRRRDDELWKPCPVPHPQARCYWAAFNPCLFVVDEKGHSQLKPEIMARYRARNKKMGETENQTPQVRNQVVSLPRSRGPETIAATCNWCNRELVVPRSRAGEIIKCECGASVAMPFDELSDAGNGIV